MNIHAIEEVRDTDQESRPVLAIRFGRGRTGGTTFLDFLIQRARRAGRTVTIADGDRKKPTLAGLYPPGESGGALRPRGKDIADVMEWVTEITSQAAADQVSMVLDMGAGIVVVELAVDVHALVGEQRRNGIADRRAPTVADVQRAGGICRHEFNHRPTGQDACGAAVALALFEDAGDDRLPRRRRKKDVDEAGTGDLDPIEPGRGRERRRDGGGELARIALERIAELQRGVARVVAVLGEFGALERQRGRRDAGRDAGNRGAQAVSKQGSGVDQVSATKRGGRQSFAL